MMKKPSLFRISAACAGFACSLAVSFSAMAAVPVGTLEGAGETSVYGWAWDSDDYNHIIPIELSVYPAGSSQVLKTDTIGADHYQDKLHTSIGDGYHGFLYSIDWNQFQETQLRVTAYAVTQTDRVFLGELTYDKETKTHTPVANIPGETSLGQEEPPKTPQQFSAGPGEASASGQAPSDSGTQKQAIFAAPNAGKQNQAVSAAPDAGKQKQAVSASAPNAGTSGQASLQAAESHAYWQAGPGVAPPQPEQPKLQFASLGMFTTTGYCNCELCSGGSLLTYSGTTPQPQHTISADINLYPIGTKLMMDDIIYTVEDIGSSIVGNKLDIYYATHEEAIAHGMQQKEVFAVLEP